MLDWSTLTCALRHHTTFQPATVIGLIYTKRLFGVRGGKTAAEADNEEAAIVNIEQAAVVSTTK